MLAGAVRAGLRVGHGAARTRFRQGREPEALGLGIAPRQDRIGHGPRAAEIEHPAEIAEHRAEPILKILGGAFEQEAGIAAACARARRRRIKAVSKADGAYSSPGEMAYAGARYPTAKT